MSSLRDVLRCPLCTADLVAPLTLRCGHSVCAGHALSPDTTVCPVPHCRPPPAPAPRQGPTVQFHPVPSPHTTARVDVTVNKIIDLVDRYSRPDDDDEKAPPRKRQRYAATEDEEDEPDLLTHLSRCASIQRTTRHDAVIPDARRAPHLEKELLSELSCEICFQLFYQPVTTPCQHTFCMKCLHRSLDHSSACPMCRQDLPGYAYFQDHPVNKTVLAIIKLTNKDLYDARGAAIEQEERDGRLDTPIFVCQLAFPCMPTLLHFFEPRYRLMLRRCLASPNPSFGMIMPPRPGGGSYTTFPSTSSSAPTPDTPSSSSALTAPSASASSSARTTTRQTSSVPYPTSHEYGTMLEIRSVQMLPDGRSVVETWGTHRFRILERGVLDGYMVGRVERVEDVEEDFSYEDLELSEEEAEEVSLSSGMAVEAPASPTARPRTAGGTPSADTAARTRARTASMPTMLPSTPSLATLIHTCLDFISTLRKGTAPWVAQRLSSTYGPMPSPRTNVSEFSFWMGLVLPIGDEEKARLLPVRSVRMRLVMCCWWIEGLRASWWFSSGCVVL